MAPHPSLKSPSSSSSTCAKFVETALCTTGPLALSYVHHGLRWVIRDHILSLIKEFPSLAPSTDHFTHDDGTTVHLLIARGALPLTPAAVELTIWLHQSYPFAPPIVYLSSAHAAALDRGHPFVNPSGAAATPYLLTWRYPRSNLLDLARNLVHVFTLCPPFVAVSADLPTPPPRDARGALASRRETTDRLYARLSTDMAAFRAQVEEDVMSLISIQSELRERARAIDRALGALHSEKESLRRLGAGTDERADVVRNWLWANNAVPPAEDDEAGPEELFDLEENDDGRAKCLLDSEAAVHAIDEVIWALDGALGDGAVPFDAYLRQVRALSREQFFPLATWTKLTEGYHDQPQLN